MSNTAAGKTEICLQIKLTKFQPICDKDEPLKRWCVRVCVGNCLPLRASPIPAVTKRIVGIFDVMAERENFVGSHCQKEEEDFFTSSPSLPHLPPFFFLSSPSSSSLPYLFILLSTPMCLFRGFRAWVSYRGFPGLRARLRRSYCQPHSLLSALWQSQ